MEQRRDRRARRARHEREATEPRLFLTFNAIERVPWEIGTLEKLDVLDLWGNSLDELPSSFEKLERLTKLSLSYNGYLKEVPPVVCTLVKLRALDFIGGPQPKRVPKEIGNLVELRKVGIGTMKGLPKSFFELPKLKTIVIHGPDEATLRALRERLPHVEIKTTW